MKVMVPRLHLCWQQVVTVRAVEQPADDFPKEARLPGCNHVLDAWDVVEHNILLRTFLFQRCFPLTSKTDKLKRHIDFLAGGC